MQIRPSISDLDILTGSAHVSRETIERLQIYVDLLVEWQVKTNLVSNATLSEVWRRHVCDSIQYLDILPQKRKWLDIGTGAGFPGLVLAIVGRDIVNFNVKLVESNHKKCAFLRKVIRDTGATATVHVSRIESVSKQFHDQEVVTARALASLDKLFRLTEGWLSGGVSGLFSKGRDYLCELEECRGVWDFDLVVHQSRVEVDSVLLEIQNLSKID